MNPAPPKLYYVYLLKSSKKNWVYIGFTSDLSRRLQEHYTSEDFSTRRYLPVELVYYEAYRSITDAKNREKCLEQHGNALRFLKKRINCSLNIIHSQRTGGAG